MSTENKPVPTSDNKPKQTRDGSKRKPFAIAESGETSRYIRHAIAAWNLQPIDISDVSQVEERLVWYFNHCAEDDIKPSVLGMCNALGIDRDTIWRWKTERSRKSDGHSDIIKKAYDLLEQLDAEGLRDGKTNPAAGIFLMKNLHAWQDKTDLVLTPNNPLGDTYSPKQIAEAIEADLIED